LDAPQTPAARAPGPHRAAATSQWESTPRTLLIVVAVIVAAIIGIYWLVAPIVVNAVAARVPHGVLDSVGDQVLASLDRDLLQPSALAPGRRTSVAAAFRRLALPAELQGRIRLEFRRSDRIGANAMALPSGTIVVTDGLVALATGDDDVVAVLAHEVGHVAGRHGVRAVVQDALLSAMITLVMGDASALAAAAPAALLNARYSRDLEREADAYAVRALRAADVPPTRLADMLERMEAEQARQGLGGSAGALQYLSTHPTTEERLRTLRGDAP
jgi:Zn-dependent protease with chaperone function